MSLAMETWPGDVASLSWGNNVCESTWHAAGSQQGQSNPNSGSCCEGSSGPGHKPNHLSSWPPSCQGLPGSPASGVSQRSHRVSGFAVTPLSHSMCPYGKCVPAWKTQSSWCVHKHRPPSLSFGVPTSYSSHPSSPWVFFTCFPLHLASSMDSRSFPAMFGSMAGNGQGEVRGGMVCLTRSYKDQLCGSTSIALDVQSIIQRVNLLPAFLLYFFMLKLYLSQLSGKESACQAGHMGLIPGSGRFPWRRKWQPSPVFLPGKSRGQRSVMSYSP